MSGFISPLPYGVSGNLASPTWVPSFPRIGNIYNTNIEIIGSTDKNGNLYYVALPVGSKAPTSTQVKNGTDGYNEVLKTGFYGTVEMHSYKKSSIYAINLLPNTYYDIWVVADEDLQLNPVKLPVSTAISYIEEDKDKLHYHVTRPKEEIIDVDGKGSYNISPIGFPSVNVSKDIDVASTKTIPRFSIGYESSVETTYTERTKNIENLFGLLSFSIDVVSISISSGTATITTNQPHGFNINSIFTLVEESNTFNGTYTIVNVLQTKIIFSISYTDIAETTITGTASYQSLENDIVKLEKQYSRVENRKYIVTNTYWKEICVVPVVNTAANINILIGGLKEISNNIESIVDDGDGYYTLTLEKPHGHIRNNEVEIIGSGKDGTYTVTKIINNFSLVVLENVTSTTVLTSPILKITPTNGQAVNVINQTNKLENGIYIVSQYYGWEFYSECYEYNGTESDNTIIEYGTDHEGNPINHHRKNYSDEEVINYLRDRLDTTIEFGRYRGNKRNDHGALMQWFFSGQKVNIGGDGSKKEIFIDSFGLGNPKSRLEIPTRPSIEQISKQVEHNIRLKKYAKWGLSNNHGNPGNTTISSTEYSIYGSYLGNLTRPMIWGWNNIVNEEGNVEQIPLETSAIVKDWPFTYTSESSDDFSGSDSDVLLDLSSWTLSTPSVNNVNLKPLSQNNKYYQKDNGYHNNITIDLTDENIVGRQHVSLIHNLHTDKTTYDNEIIKSVLDDLYDNSTFSTGIHIIHREISGNITKYYVKQRSIDSLTNIIPKGTGWSENTLTYDSDGPNDIKVYIESTEVDFVKFSHPIKTTIDLLQDLVDYNYIIPIPLNPLIPNCNILDEIFTYNSLLDYNQSINNSEKIRSKKTFIHLPTPLDLLDGQLFELDVSLPVDQTQDSFPYNTVGSLSGYKNFVTQPRVYVLSGYQSCNTNVQFSVNSLYRINDFAYIETDIDHLIYTQTFIPTDIDIVTNFIGVSDVNEFSIGDIVRFKTTDVLPTGLSLNTNYTISDIKGKAIRLQGVTISGIGSGIHSVMVKKSLYVTISGSNQNDYNNEFLASTDDFNILKFPISELVTTPATGNIIVAKIVTVSNNDSTYGLTERNNSHVFGIMPENEFVSEDNIYHQTFKPSNLLSSDKRVLLSTVYPTSVNTFAWRLDNSPKLRMLQWSLLALSEGVGSASHVAYNRNRNIVEQLSYSFNSILSDDVSANFKTITTNEPHLLSVGSTLVVTDVVYPTYDESNYNAIKNGDYVTISKVISPNKFEFESTRLSLGISVPCTFTSFPFDSTIYQNPITYFPYSSYSETLLTQNGKVDHLINYKLRIKYPNPINSFNTEEDNNTVGDYKYQAKKAFSDLISDFYRSRIVVSNDYIGFDEYFQGMSLDYENAYDGNHGSLTLPTSFYDQVADREFIKFDTTTKPNQSNNNAMRWITKALYNPEFIVESQNNTNYNDKDPYETDDSVIGLQLVDYKNYLSEYFIEDSLTKSNSGTRYIPGTINPTVDPSFEFSVGSKEETGNISRLVNILIENGKNNVLINDVKRILWDSYFSIPQGVDRKSSNRFFVAGSQDSYPIQMTAFYGYNYLSFSTIFSPDYFTPTGKSIVDVEDYGSLISYPTVRDTLKKSLSSNLISNKFFNEGYDNTFSSINSRNDNLDVEEYIRNFISGYSNRMPFRFYNSFRIIIHGTTLSNSHSTNINLLNVPTESHVERIYKYSVNDYIKEYTEIFNDANIGKYIDDNFCFYNGETDTSSVVAQDINDTWLYFENGDNTESNIKDLIHVSGAQHLTDINFYKEKFVKSYTRIKMKFIFSKDAGRWYTLDYRQFPTSYLTPSFGNVALKHQEKSTIFSDSDGTKIEDFVSIYQPDTTLFENIIHGRKNLFKANVIENDRKKISFKTTEYKKDNFQFNYVDDVIVYIPKYEQFETSSPLFDKYIITYIENIVIASQPDISNNYLVEIWLKDQVPTSFGNNVRISKSFNTIKEKSFVYDFNIPNNSLIIPSSIDFKFNVGDTIIYRDNEGDSNYSGGNELRDGYPYVISEVIVQYENAYIKLENTVINAGATIGTGNPPTIENVSVKYPINLQSNDKFEKKLLWKNPEKYTYNDTTINKPYYQMKSMEINKFSYPFLSDEFAYDENGYLLPELDLYETHDILDIEKYRFTKLINPANSLNFIVPNNVHGGLKNSLQNEDTYIPHLWNVFWNIRPAVSAMYGTDVPSKTERSGGKTSDPTLNSMFEYPNMDILAFHVPWHNNMKIDFLTRDYMK